MGAAEKIKIVRCPSTTNQRVVSSVKCLYIQGIKKLRKSKTKQNTNSNTLMKGKIGRSVGELKHSKFVLT